VTPLVAAPGDTNLSDATGQRLHKTMSHSPHIQIILSTKLYKDE